MYAFVRCLAVAASGAALSVSLLTPAVAADAPCKSLGYVQARVVEKADQGVDALRNYIYITRGIHQLDMMQVAGSLDAWRADARCAKLATEQAEASASVALKTSP